MREAGSRGKEQSEAPVFCAIQAKRSDVASAITSRRAVVSTSKNTLSDRASHSMPVSRPLIEVRYTDGLYLPEPDLWLDPPRPAPRAFISHAHSDHFARHPFTICSAVTRELIHQRYGAMADAAVLAPAYGESVDWEGFELRLVPAGHIFGSSMCHLTRKSDGASLLYTGDFKLKHGLTAEPAQLLPASTLIMETTYGAPQYRFPPREEVIAKMLHFVRETLDEGDIPVLLGYSLGKAQEILCALNGAGMPVMLHSSMLKLTDAYREASHALPAYTPFDPAHAAGHVLILPPSAARSQAVRKLKKCRTAMLSGWALSPGAKYRYQVDEVFPLSDHADYDELLQCVAETQPSLIYTVHGFTREFAQDLRNRGWDARSLVADDQLELALASPIVAEDPLPYAASAPASQPTEVHDPQTFAAWAQTCELVAAESSRLKKQEHLAHHFRQLSGDDLANAARWFSGVLDTPSGDAGPLNVGWALIRRVLLQVSGLSEPEYRLTARSQGDLGRTAYLVLQRSASAQIASRSDATPSPTKTEIAQLFQRLRDAKGAMEKAAVLSAALARMSPLDGSYLVRLMTGELRVGSKEGLVEEAVALAFHQQGDAVREASMLLGDIGQATLLAAAGRLNQAAPTLFVPVKVMLASPEESAESIWERFHGDGDDPDDEEPEDKATATAVEAKTEAPPKEEQPIWLEDKFDGIRAQLHCGPSADPATPRVEIYTRDLKRVTGSFPELVAAAQKLTDGVILDGEIIAYAEDRKLTFNDLQHRLGRREQADLFIPSDISVRYVVFDLLWLNGQDLLHRPLEERRQHLERVRLPHAIQRIAVSEANSPEEIDAAFHAARRAGNEGLIAKDRHSRYSPGKRGKSWLKLKKAFSTLDVVVVKAEQGHGKRSHVLSDYTFAVREDQSGELLVIGKAYSGLTDVEIEELTEHFKQTTVSQRGHVRTVIPDTVLEIAFDSIQPSTRHSSGLAMRFPRIKAIRKDKAPSEIDTLSQARKLAGLVEAEPKSA